MKLQQLYDLADQGLNIFPVRSNGRKIPHIKGWYENASSDKEKIKAWWTKWPDAYVGLPTGEKNMLWVIDVDVKNGKDGEASLDAVDAEIPATLDQTTASGGRHLFYKWKLHYNIPSRTNILGEGVDVRCDGGFVVIAPSEGYEMLGGFDMDLIADSPDDLVELVSKKIMYSNKDPDATRLDREEVAERLSDLKIYDYQTRDKWRNIIMSVKSASGGEDWGLELLIDWSMGDADHFEDDVETACIKVWESADIDREGGITAGTLIKESNNERLERRVQSAFDGLEDFGEIEATGFNKDEWLFNDKTKKLTASNKNVYSLILQDEIKIQSNKKSKPNPFFHMVALDELQQATVFTSAPFWMGSRAKSMIGERVSDNTLHNMMVQVQHTLGLTFSKSVFHDAINGVASLRGFHPVVNYLERLKWDGIPRVENWIQKYVGVKEIDKDTTYLRAISRATLLGAVARAYCPGIKFDNMLVLESEKQGVGKSTAVDILGKKWSGCPMIEIGHKDAEQNLQGIWIVEWGELASLNKKEASDVKDFISRRHSTFRRSHGREAETVKRGCIFIGTTNISPGQGYLKDPSGARRYWPIEVVGAKWYIDEESGKKALKVDFDGLKDDIDQIWAEAVEIYMDKKDSKYPPWILNPAEDFEARIHQEKRQQTDSRIYYLEEWLTSGDGRKEDHLTGFDVATCCFNIPADQATAFKVRDYATMLSKLGWKYSQYMVKGKRLRCFKRPKDWDDGDVTLD